jgi:thioredoxin 1
MGLGVPAGKASSAYILLVSVMAMALVGGCATEGKVQPIATTGDFQQQVIQAKGPVLVDFYKEDCPTCVIQEACLDKLADEYAGKVRFFKFKVREAYMVSSCPEFMDQYKLFWVPTTVLFVDGQEKQRWVLNHVAGEFRGALDEASGRSPAAPAVAAVDGEVPAAAAWPTLMAMPGGNTTCVEGQGCPIRTGP